MIRAERRVRRHDDSHRAIDAREFLNRCYVLDVTHAGAAVLGRKDGSKQSKLADFFNRRERKFAGFVPLHDVGLDLALGKFADALL